MPSISPDVIGTTIATQLYPEDFSGALGYTTQTDRLALILSEALVTCNVNALTSAFGAASSGYQFSVFPGIHAQDVMYTFFNGPAADFFGNVVDPGVASVLQSIIVDFTISGAGNLVAVALLQQPGLLFQPNSTTFLNLDVNGLTAIQDPAANPRCQFWQQGLFSA